MRSLVEGCCVDPRLVPHIWPLVEPLLRSATTRTGLSLFESLKDGILNGPDLLWIAVKDNEITAACSTSLQLTDGGKVCVITACGGRDIEQCGPILDQIETYAKNEGCARVRIYGRKGWQRMFAGYRAKYEILDKEMI